MAPRTRYARSGELSIAYQVVGDGSIDLVHAPGYISHLEYAWEEPGFARYLNRLAAFSRLILFDKRGTGLSDRVSGVAPLAERMDDVRAVMDAAGSRRAVIYGFSESTPLAVLFAATYPERVTALVLFDANATETQAPDYPWAPTAPQLAAALVARSQTIHETWASGNDLAFLAPSRMHDPAFRAWFTTFQRLSASPGAVIALDRMNALIDVRHVLPTIRVPTLVLHRMGTGDDVVEPGRYVARHIPGAMLVELIGIDYLPYVGDSDALVDEIEAFVTGVRPIAVPDSVLATVLVVEIADSARHATALGDRHWSDLEDRFGHQVDRVIDRFHGQIQEQGSNRTIATFDGPMRAIRCATAIHTASRELGLTLRSGLHTGECERRGNQLRGVAVSLAVEVAGRAAADEILVSSTVRDLVAGAGLRFADRGALLVSGEVGPWRLFLLLPDRLDDPAPRDERLLGPTKPSPRLTRREQDVLPLVVRGLSNQQIADALSIGERTVESHVSNILAKWGLANRAQLVAALSDEDRRTVPSPRP
jgi:pimeloyl-ACP methyl ester carboxylesterase/DNA-binding CsgD family transcriptional regulator/class 3 adenylate cyclase